MDGFYEKFLEKLGDEDELRTIFYIAQQNTGAIMKNPAFQEFSADDARVMAFSLAVSLEVIRRYENKEP